MPQPELLGRVVGALRGAGVDYMVTGSLVSSLQGEPRSTHDIDIVVSLPPRAVPALVRAFGAPDYYLDERAILDAIATGGMVNLIDGRTGDKVDLWVLTDDPFDQSRFARREPETVFGVPVFVSRPEDTILMKLRWANLSGGSEKQYTDALRVYEVQHGRMDLGYLAEWGDRLGVRPLLDRLRAEADAI